MATSTQLTDFIKQDANPASAEFEIWKKTRYLVAQEPAASDFTETRPGHYKGRAVIPGPKANPKISDQLGFKTTNINDFQTLKNRFYIRFVDNRTTDNADESVRKALFTVMSKVEADDYEKALTKYHKKNTTPLVTQGFDAV